MRRTHLATWALAASVAAFGTTACENTRAGAKKDTEIASEKAKAEADAANLADLEMHTSYSGADPEVFMRQFCSWEASTKENKWSGRNSVRWQNKEYDDTFKAATVELDPVKRAALLIKCNDLVVNDQVVIPVVSRPDVAAVKNKLVAELSGWDSNTWDIASWYIES